MNDFLKAYRRDCLLGAIGALLMLVGDLCLSVIPASSDDSGLFQREAYFSGTYEEWRFPLLVWTGMIGIVFCCFAVKVCYMQIKPQHRKARVITAVGGTIYVTTAMTLHFLIGSLADWTSTLSPLLGSENASELIRSQYDRVFPPMYISYFGMAVLVFVNIWAIVTKKAIVPRRMLIFHPLTLLIVMALIPDIRQLLGAEVSTVDFVLSQTSGNAGLFIYMLANLVWALRKKDISPEN